jgi:hypothetical protein
VKDLDEIQAFFAAQLRTRRSLPKDEAVSEQARSIVRASGGLSPVERLEIYREQFWLRHTSSLVEDFPGLSGILGQRAWAALIEGYLAAYPPQSFTLRDLGLCLPHYIETQTTLAQLRLCCDMARLEVRYIEIFDAGDAAPIAPETLAGIPDDAWPRVRIQFHPALRLLKTEYPVAALRRQLIEGQARSEHLPMPPREPQSLLLFRRNLQMFHEPLSEGAYALLSALTRGVALVPACESAQAEVPEEAADIAEKLAVWFQSWAARGFVVGVEL